MKTEVYSIKSGENKGISLIALTVTIIVIIILAGVSIAMLTQNNGVISNAKRAAITTEFSKYKEELSMFKTQELLNNRNFYDQSITAGKNVLNYNTKKGDEGNIRTVIPDLSDNYIDNFEVIKGELLFTSQDKFLLNIAKSLGIQINPYKIVDGELLSSDTNLMLMDENGVLTIPETVTRIGEGAFSNVQGLKTIIIPYTVKEIEQNAFANNTEIEKVEFQTKTKEDGTIEGCETIGMYAFNKCTALKEVSLPKTLTVIKFGAFQYSGLESINIPGTVNTIEGMTFYGTQLKKAIINEGTESIIGWGAFGNNLLTSIKLPSTINYIGTSNIFPDHNYLINIDTSDNSYYTYENGTLMNRNKTEIYFISVAYYKNKDTYIIDKGIEKTLCDIPNNIKNVEIPASLKDLWSIPKSIEKITIDKDNTIYSTYNNGKQLYKGTELMSSFTNEKNINIKDGTQIIHSDAFGAEMNAETITLADSVVSLGGYILPQNSTKLKKVFLGRNVKDVDGEFALRSFNVQIEISQDNPYIRNDDGIIYSKDGKKLIAAIRKINGKFKVPANVTEIGNNPFRQQTEMSELILPKGLKKIGNLLIRNNMMISSLEIPSTVETIGDGTFSDATNLKDIYIDKKQNSISGSPWGLPIGERGIHWKN